MHKRNYSRFSPLLIIILLLLLSSCSHVRRDGPPNYYVDASRIPNAVPKAEPFSKLGNMSSYVVNGRRYYTLKSNKHYEAVGVASWYGTLFHKKRTSSGEPYNMLAMTAAHKTLPLPTYVQVTNLKNQRTIIVKVNDRGPFESNRLIDLSYVAAKKLDMLGHGTALVRIKAIDPHAYSKSLATSKTQKKRYHHFNYIFSSSKPKHLHEASATYLEVGAYRTRAYAEKMKGELENLLDVPVFVFSPLGNDHLYRVQVGPYDNTLALNKVSDRLKELGLRSTRA